MFQSLDILPRLASLADWFAQVPVDQRVATPEKAALVFSGPKFFVALIAGVALAFAIQFVLTNLSVAAGISYLGHQSDSDSNDHESGSVGGTIRKIGFAVGLWTLITVSIALFIACLLAVKLSLLDSRGLGAIVGLVIWAVYFSLLVWFSSSTVGSLIGSIVNTATSGFQAIVGTATAALGAKAVNDQVVATAEAAAAAVRREIGSAIDPSNIRESIEDYIDAIRPPELDLSRIRREFESLHNDPELKAIAGTGSPMEVADRLRHIDRNTFVNLVSSRTDLSKRDINRLVDQLEAVWRQTVGRVQQVKDPTAELVDYLKSAQPDVLRSGELSQKIDQLIDAIREQGQRTQYAMTPAKQQEPSLMDRAMQYGMTAIMGTVLGRSDLSDLDVEKILGQLQGAKDKLTDKTQQVAGKIAEKAPGLPFNTIKADVENYILNAYPWHLNRETIRSEFKQVIFDPDANPGTVRRHLEQINRSTFVDLLTQRGDLTPARVNDIADQLEQVRSEVLSTVQTSEVQEKSQDLRSRVENYLRNTGKDELNPEGIERDLKTLFDDPDAGVDDLRNRFNQFDRETLVALLAQRQDISPEDADRIVGQFEGTRDRILNSAQEAQERVKSEAAALRVRVESYLRNTNKDELNPEGIKRDFRTLLDDPQAGVYALQGRLSQFDRETLVALLSQRQDISPEEADRIIGQLQDTIHTITHAPQIVAGKAQDQYDQVTTAIADYLRRTNLEELDPNGIQRDLNTLLHDPKAGAYALGQRLSQVDRETLVKLLSQRGDLTEEQVNRVIDQVLVAIRQISRAPRRLASRTQERVRDFQANVENYLLNTNKEELNPEGIKRDLQLLLNDPRAGLSNIGDRLSHFDRATIVALLAQRPDMTEEEANRVVDQVLSVRDQFVAQIQKVQNAIQSVVDRILARIRDYLNSLDRPELNYESIKRDVRTLFYDPKAGFEAMRDRLSSFNRDTLVALLSSREDISEEQANRIIDQIEGARTSVLRRADRLQEEAQRRLDEMKHQAKRQAIETRKAAETAAWWLFGTAIASAAASAIAGALGVVPTTTTIY